MRQVYAVVTPIVYRASANTDLADIRRYFTAISEQTYDNVINDINETIVILTSLPEAGAVYKPGRRRIISTKYKFIISYAYKSSRVEIVGVSRFQNR